MILHKVSLYSHLYILKNQLDEMILYVLPCPKKLLNVPDNEMYISDVAFLHGTCCLSYLTRISLVSTFWDIGKQYSPRFDTAGCSIPSGAILFAITEKQNKKIKSLLMALKI